MTQMICDTFKSQASRISKEIIRASYTGLGMQEDGKTILAPSSELFYSFKKEERLICCLSGCKMLSQITRMLSSYLSSISKNL